MTKAKAKAIAPDAEVKETVAGLSEWRASHLEELDANLKVAREIRDSPDSTPRDRNEAVKAIARMMGIMGNERPKPAGESRAGKAWPELTPAEHAMLEKLLNEHS